ncbi:hypothetical protein HETIRDRAFT_322362 [Heterobasidion irregulare TC 32-1]|uniref:DUF6589 domain-containing protein n=1 Tax=Heterobasidion irregulare (strain TC 32-1) TaxID=747525 RepID=W4K1B2_HETIT|nr:uncharacterized protein HETIRDRAFT_322362 [Heterobasidion irregulare TC 32-1]ETW79509.1 hypothetical protein HETIRDRAFT_322362 [Heterobasidion irregulare TC 32-1]
MAASHRFITTHLGQPNHLLTNPTSLVTHNMILECKPIVATSLPPFQTCQDLIFIFFYAQVLHYILLVAELTSLDKYMDSLTWETLQSHAATVVNRFTDNCTVHHLQQEHAVHSSHRGNMVFENAILFLRDALHLREFLDAIKAGDSGHVLNILKITHVWPASLIKVVLNNWLVNPTGSLKVGMRWTYCKSTLTSG